MIDFIKNRKKIAAVFGITVILLILGIIILFKYKAKAINVTGNEIVSSEEIMANYTKGPFGDNRLVIKAKDKLNAFDTIPFVRDYDIRYEEDGTVTIQIYEKALVACFYYMGEYVYFDKDGVILETSKETTPGIPCIEGVSFKNFTMNTRINIDNPDQIKMILDLSELINHYSINVEKVRFDNNYEVTLYSHGIRVMLGKKKLYDQQIASVTDVLNQSIENNLKGTIDMKTYSKGDKIILKQQ